jgi:transposase
MKTTAKNQKINLRNDMFVLACDVGEKDIHWTFRPVAFTEEEPAKKKNSIPNNTFEIRRLLMDCLEKAGMQAKQIVVAYEPTGIYHRKLGKGARELGMQTTFVSGRVVKNMEGLEANDNGKADPRDPHVIFKLVVLKSGLLTDRELPEAYARLRELHEARDFESREAATMRCRLHTVLLKLFPDFSFDNDFVKGAAGRAFFALYKLNPWRVRSDDESTFRKKMGDWIREAKGRVQKKTIDRLWNDVLASTSTRRPSAELLADREQNVCDVMDHLSRHEEKKAEKQMKMLAIYAGLVESKTLKDIPIQEFEKAKIIAETGPLNDYQAAAQVLRMAGLTIQIRDSGKYRGQRKITKTGRSLLRKVLFQIVFSQVGCKKGLFRQKNEKLKEDGGKQAKGKGAGKKRMVQFMRKLLKAIFVIHKTKAPFSQERLFNPKPNKKAA